MAKKNNFLTQCAYAKKIGCSRQWINQAVKTGLIPTKKIKNKLMINPVDPAVKEFEINLKAVKEDNQKSAKIKLPVEVKEKKKNKKKDSSEEEEKLPDYLKDLVDSNQLTATMALMLPKAWMEKLQIYERMKHIRITTEKAKHELIPRKLIKVIFGKLHEIDENEFKQLKNKIVPDVASIMGCSDSTKMLEAEKRIDEEVYKILKHIKIEIDRFLKKISKEKE